jgi:hypothetical protein
VEAARTGWRLPVLDPYSAGTMARVLLLMPLPQTATQSHSPWPMVSLCNADPLSRALYATAIYQNRLPLHWCLACPMFLYEPHTGQHDQARSRCLALDTASLTSLIAMLPTLRAVVLVGRDVRTTWRAAAPALQSHVRVWFCQQGPVQQGRASSARGHIIRGQLPQWHDVAP